MNDLIKELRHFGLSDKEAAVYLASLNLGPASVQDLSHKSKVNRATTYVVIESLTTQGLMSTFVKDKKRYFALAAP
jgi:sugar-specific transcriptional regulator TrmB